MDLQDNINPTGRSPRRSELQGPRPTPLRINKDSHKIKKPPLAPPPQLPLHPSHHHQPPPRQPIIIYTVSPKVIHTTPDDFMSLVQRLTGSSSSSSSSSSANNVDPFNNSYGGMVSPAARYATIEKAMSPMGKKQQPGVAVDDHVEERVEKIMDHHHHHHAVLESTRPNNMFQGILSPGPASLTPIPPSFFSPQPNSDPTMVNFLNDLSPSAAFFQSNGGFIMPSPFNIVSPHTPSIDLFNYFLD